MAAEAGDLIFPVDCTLGQDCFIQQYVDREPGPGIADFACGTLTYEAHDGTDIRLVDDAAMAAGVAVRAATGGRVLGVRDGVPDHRQGTPDAPDVSGRECGNGVLIERDDGWRLQYCHMRRGSVRVGKGDEIAAGEVLGQVGLSGQTQFPHLHVTIRDPSGRVIDPFDARPREEPCALADSDTLWRDIDASAYRPGGALTAGFLDRVPEYEEVKAGTANAPLGRDAPALVFWAYFYGLRQGDRIELGLTGPGGEVIAETTHQMPRDRAVEYRAVGRRARGDWPAGSYDGTARLVRGGAEISHIARRLELR